jgi:hypothetical protein
MCFILLSLLGCFVFGACCTRTTLRRTGTYICLTCICVTYYYAYMLLNLPIEAGFPSASQSERTMGGPRLPIPLVAPKQRSRTLLGVHRANTASPPEIRASIAQAALYNDRVTWLVRLLRGLAQG